MFMWQGIEYIGAEDENHQTIKSECFFKVKMPCGKANGHNPDEWLILEKNVVIHSIYEIYTINKQWQCKL